ncbi:hypothetical protein GCM10010416_56880 [Streptomyces caniferus]
MIPDLPTVIKHRHAVESAHQQHQNPSAGPRRGARRFACGSVDPVRTIGGTSDAESRVVPAMTLKNTHAWPGLGVVPPPGLGAARLRYLRTRRFPLSDIAGTVLRRRSPASDL